ncbi:preprotein translocase subunit SecG [Akkermansiaceae bacterium]|nr:preprotein translocase subunit SecG [Akkermansiaceae bacterium]
MTLAFLDISIWINLIVIAHVVVSALLILVILMQRPKQEGLGAAFGSGMTDAAWGARTTDVLQRGTVYLGTLFFVFSLVLSILVAKKNAQEGKRADSDGATAKVAVEQVEEKIEEKIEEVDPTAGFSEELNEDASPPAVTPAPAEIPAPAESPAGQ